MLKRLGILTSGGDSPGMNPAIRSITRTALAQGMEVIGIENGYQGIFDRLWMPLGTLEVSGRIRVAGTFLGSSRCDAFRAPEAQKEAVDILHQEHIDALVVIGGDGSMAGARALHNLGYPVIGLPGTIDNDICGTDIGIGVDTALNTILHLVDMIKATAASHRRCFVVEVMGRGSGYLALMSAIATGSQAAVIPEFQVDYSKIIEALNSRTLRKHNNSVVIVAEGVCSAFEAKKNLENGPIPLINKEMRVTILGHVQRGGTPTFYDRYLASRMGEYTVLALKQGESGSMVAIVNGKMQLLAFDDFLGKNKLLPADAIRLARNLGIEIGVATES